MSNNNSKSWLARARNVFCRTEMYRRLRDDPRQPWGLRYEAAVMVEEGEDCVAQIETLVEALRQREVSR